MNTTAADPNGPIQTTEFTNAVCAQREETSGKPPRPSGGGTNADSSAASKVLYADFKPLERDTLFAELEPLVRRLTRQYGVNKETRRDLQDEIYRQFCALLDDYDPRSGVPFRPYLVRQLSAGIYAYTARHEDVNNGETAPSHISCGQNGRFTLIGAAVTCDAEVLRHDPAHSLSGAISKLPDLQRKVLVWRYYENRCFEDIARLLGSDVSDARLLLRHGLLSLRSQLYDNGIAEM